MFECDCGIDFNHKLTCGQGVEVVPRHGAQPAYITRGLLDDARHLIDPIADQGDETP